MTRVMQQKQKAGSDQPPAPPTPPNPIKTQNTMKTPSTIDPRPSSLRVRFQHTPIDRTRLGAKQVSGNEYFLSILGPSGEDDYRPLHGNQTPKGSGQPGNSAGAPMPVYGMLLRAKKK